MGTNLVIVAIPDENDRVWRVSSEKVPHLTLLFLGEADGVKNVDKIVQFVEHAASETLKRFYLPIDRRDKLGDDEADVLLFKTKRYYGREIKDFRSTLLQDPNIKTAYDAADQFEGPWKPHLTLGYPETPAKNDDTDRDQGFYDVAFTKIAVWTGDYDGPEFILKDWDDEEDIHGSVYNTPNAAWSAVAERGQEAVAELFKHDPDAKIDVAADLEHHGVKGMKWGVRKDKVTGAAKKVGKGIDNTLFELNANSDSTHHDIIKGAKKLTKSELPAIKAQHPNGGKLKERMKNPLSDEAKAYRKDVKAAYVKNLEKSANDITNLSGSRRYTLKDFGDPNTSKYFWNVSTEKNEAKHAAENDGTIDLRIRPIFDEDGYITDFEIVDSAAQTVEHGMVFMEGLFASDEDLEHYGIKGMRWGQRKNPPSAVAPSASSKVPHGDKRKTKVVVEGGQNHPAHEDAIKVAEAKAKLVKSGPAALSNQELREVAARSELEQRVAVLTSNKGKQFVTNQLRAEGQQLARQGTRAALKKGAKRAAAAGALAI